MKQSIGEFLATLRKAHGYTQQEVADRLSVSNRTVSAWERGAVLPDILLLPALAELYGVTADEILAGERSAEAASRPALSEKSETKLLKRKLAKFSAQAYLLAGLFALGLLFFFLGLFYEIVTVVWTGFAWWLLLLFAGLTISAVSLSCLFAFWRSAEVSADEELPYYGAYLILLRRKLALALCIPAIVPFGFFVFSLIVLFAGTDRPIPILLAVALAVSFALLFAGIFLPSSAVKKYGGEEAAPIRARNRKRYQKCALFCLIPVLLGTAVIALFAFWQPEWRTTYFTGDAAELTAYLETLSVKEREYRPDGSYTAVLREYVLPISEVAKSAEEWERYDLGEGFSCIFRDGMESCTIYRDEPFTVMDSEEAISELTVYRFYSDGRTFSAYNARFNVRNMKRWISAVDWRGISVPLEIRIKEKGDGFELLGSYNEDYFPLAAPLSALAMLAGVGVCVLVCAVKRERLKVKL